MSSKENFLRQLYLEDLKKEVCYDNHNTRCRVRHIGNWERIKSSLSEGVEQITFPLTTDDKRKVWVWSDTHFCHKNIIKYSDRPYDDVKQMNEHLIANHNETVAKPDISIWVGDVAFGSTERANELLDQCNGYKILIIGNHDFNKGKLRSLNFNEIHLIRHIKMKGVNLVLTHYPMFNLPLPYINVHGHVHIGVKNDELENSVQHVNVNCEFIKYKPINLDVVIKMAKAQWENIHTPINT